MILLAHEGVDDGQPNETTEAPLNINQPAPPAVSAAQRQAAQQSVGSTNTIPVVVPSLVVLVLVAIVVAVFLRRRKA